MVVWAASKSISLNQQRLVLFEHCAVTVERLLHLRSLASTVLRDLSLSVRCVCCSVRIHGNKTVQSGIQL
jgi:hypothetical protein